MIKLERTGRALSSTGAALFVIIVGGSILAGVVTLLWLAFSEAPIGMTILILIGVILFIYFYTSQKWVN